mgnify:CR=1 FL=1
MDSELRELILGKAEVLIAHYQGVVDGNISLEGFGLSVNEFPTQIISLIQAHGYTKVDDTTRIFFDGKELNEEAYQEYMEQWAKDHGWVDLEENQELPRPHKKNSVDYFKAQQDMLRAGFRKVKGQPPVKETE